MAARPEPAPLPLGVTAIVPCFNEEDGVEEAYAEIRAQLARYADFELLFVDDGSTDGTLAIVKRLAAQDGAVKYLSLARNFGLEAAFTAGFKYAQKEWTVQLDADLQSPPEEMHKLIRKGLEGYDVVFGVRENRQDSWFRRTASSAQHWIARRWLGIELLPGASVWRVVRTSVAKKIVALELATPYFIATVPLVGARYTGVPTSHNPRRRGTPKWTLRRLVVHSLDLFFGYSFRLIAVVFVCLAAAVALCALVIALALAGQIDAGFLAGAAYVSSTLAFGAVAVIAGYVMRVAKGQARPAQFYIREANIPIAPADDLYEHEGAPAAAVREVVR
jgi:glycosyltransferase involved in cell wall biosynthesis